MPTPYSFWTTFHERGTPWAMMGGLSRFWVVAGASCLCFSSCSGYESRTTAPSTTADTKVAENSISRAPRRLSEPSKDEEKEAAAPQAPITEPYPLFGVTYHFLAQVFAKPSNRSSVIGYMRRGANLRAGNRVEGKGCPEGWHEVPGTGFVCNNGGFLIGATPQSFEPSPLPPTLDAALPYAYAYTARDDVPQYWRIPTDEEETATIKLLAELREAEKKMTAQGTSADGTPVAADQVEAPAPPGIKTTTDLSEEAKPEVQGPALPDYIRMRMLRGFYVSVDRVEMDSEREYYRTVRGAYVRVEDVLPNEPPAMRGVVLGGEEWTLPLALVFRGNSKVLSQDPLTGRLHLEGTADRFTAYSISGRVTIDGKHYVRTRDGLLIRDGSVRFAEPVARAPLIPPTDQWIHINLAEQTLVAYNGDQPVFATLVSSGKPNYETPVGLYRIGSKHVSITMDDPASAEAYSIEDVPWTMYFHQNFALHGAFWHSRFGQVRSHGCVNLAPADARWLFQWTTPALPAPWHGIFADKKERPGTWVWIESGIKEPS